MKTETDVVLETENGLISIALSMYAQQVLNAGGSNELYQKAMDLHYKFRDMKDTNE